MKKNAEIFCFARPGTPGTRIEWEISQTRVPYLQAVERMEARVDAIIKGTAPELVWLLEHPPLYSAGTSANPHDLKDPERFPVFATGRGGQYTYHGPGQRVAYVMLDLRKRSRDVRAFVRALEEWIILTLAELGVKGGVRDDRIGVWVTRPDEAGTREDKIAAIGIRLRRWVSFHGIALNVHPDLTHFDGIVPCGIAGHGVTSLRELGGDQTMNEVDAALRVKFELVFGKTKEC